MASIGTRPGEAYENGGRMYYDTRDGRTYRTGREGFGLFVWSVGRGGWQQLRGETQWRPMPLATFRATMARMFDADPAPDPWE